MTVMLRAEAVDKTFTLHLQAGLTLPVLHGVALEIHSGHCLALTGPSGAGKSTLMRALHGNYRIDHGHIRVRHQGEMIDLASASPRTILAIRRETLGYVSQFLRVIPRVPAIEIVAEAARHRAITPDQAHTEAEDLLLRLNIPRRLHTLPPATFSGGEQQRINLARGFAGRHPILLLDEPTASLDPANTATIIAMIQEAKANGTALIGIFHDTAVRDAVADHTLIIAPQQETV